MKAPTRTMNPRVPESVVARAYQVDELSARAEYGVEFRDDIETFVSRDVVDLCVVLSRAELPPRPGVAYRAFVDPSGGSADSMTLAIAHQEGEDVVHNLVQEWCPPFSPEAVVKEACDTMRALPCRDHDGQSLRGRMAPRTVPEARHCL